MSNRRHPKFVRAARQTQRCPSCRSREEVSKVFRGGETEVFCAACHTHKRLVKPAATNPHPAAVRDDTEETQR